MKQKAGLVLAALGVLLVAAAVSASSVQRRDTSTGKPKLLYILLDGFRFDYVDDLPKSDLPGFDELLSNGVKARYVNPLYPSISYPSWTTLVTGLYAESHGIVGNYFYDSKDKDVFSLFDKTATGKAKWWTAEPLWITATKASLRVALHLWSRCDVPFDGVEPEYCMPFEKITGPEIFRTNIDKALKNFQDGFDVVQVYTEHLDNTGHVYGPETQERRQATMEIDETLVHLQQQLKEMGMDDEVNIVIVSDHGMTSTGPDDVTKHEVDKYLPADGGVESIADKGAYMSIKVLDGRLDDVYESLLKMPNVTVYKTEDIPEYFHLADSQYIHDIIITSNIGTYVLSSAKPVMLPQTDDIYDVVLGNHGYSAKEPRMRSIFYAKGPAFKSNYTLSPIDIVDIYQVLTNVLDIEARPHNGTWDNVKDAFTAASPPSPHSGFLVSAGAALVVALNFVRW